MAVDSSETRGLGAVDDETAETPVVVRLRAIGWALLAVTVVLNIASMAVPALVDHPLTRDRGEVQNYLDVFVEGNLPTWWSVALLTVAAVAHGTVGAMARARGARGSWAWFGTAGMLALLSLDDHTQLHERLDRIGRKFVTFDGFPFYWLLPGLAAGAIVAVAVLLLAIRLSGPARWYLAGGCALLLGSALGMEALQGLLIASGESGPLYVLTYHAEELGENLGVLLMLAAAVRSLDVSRDRRGCHASYNQS